MYIAVVVTVLTQTILNKNYDETQLQKTGAYSTLANGITKEVVDKSSGAATVSQATITSELQTVVTPQLVKQRLDTTLDQLQAYYKQGGAVPTLDVSDLVREAQAAGLPLQAGFLAQPIVLDVAKPVQNASHKVQTLGWVLAGVTSLLAMAITLIAVRRHNYKPLANIFTSLGSLLAASGIIGYILVAEFSSHIDVSSTNNDFVDVTRQLVNTIGQDIAKRLIIIGAALFVFGIITRLMVGRVAKKNTVMAHTAPGSGSNAFDATLLKSYNVSTDTPVRSVRAQPVSSAEKQKPPIVGG